MNTRRIKNIYFLAAFLLVAFFVFNVNQVIAADDNLTVPACDSDDCDNSNAYCSVVHSLHWTASGYPSGAGNPSCCGDDSQEFYRTRQVSPLVSGLANSTDDYSCCQGNNYCVYESTCYDSQFDRGASMTDRYIHCSFIGAGYYAWEDCDAGGCGVCGGGSLVYSGESSVGEYPNTSTLGCCGDDSNEAYVTTFCPGYSGSGKCCNSSSDKIDASGNCVASCPAQTCGDNSYNGTEYDYNQTSCQNSINSIAWGLTTGNASGSCWNGKCCGDDTGEVSSSRNTFMGAGNDQVSFTSSSSDKACCATGSYGPCVYSSTCYSHGAFYSVNGENAYCSNFLWGDGDQMQTWCAVSYNWAQGGESSTFGEYNSGTATECCGDDLGEYYASLCPSVTGVDRKCCNSASDGIRADGTCGACNQPPGSFSLSSPANGAIKISQNPTLSWGASTDPEGTTVTYNVYYCCDSAAGCSLPGSPDYSVSGTSRSLFNLKAGDYCRWNVIASDGSLQTSSSNGPFSFQVNSDPNTPSSPSPSSGATCVSVRPSLSWSGGDPDAGDTLTYQIKWCTGTNCTPTNQASTGNTNYTPGSDFPANTLVRWQIVSTDALGASITGPIWSFTTSPTTPTATLIDGVNSTCTAGPDTVAVNWSNGSTPLWGYSSDATCNASDTYGTSGASATVSTTHADYVCFKNSDSCSVAGYSSAQGPLKIDTAAPTISSVTATNPPSTCETILFTISGAADTGCGGLAASAYSFDGGSSWQAGNTKQYTGVTSQSVQVRVKDSVGNIYSTTASGTASSCSAPTISFNPTSRSYNYTNVSVTATASDADGIASTLYCWSSSGNCTPSTSFTNGSALTQSSTGSWTLCVKATDNTNNSNTQCSSPYEIDKTAPTVTALSTSVGSTCSGTSATVSWSASDTGGSGLNRTELWANSGSGWAVVSGCSSSPCTVTVSATTQYGVHAIDNAGNCIDESGSHCGGVSSDGVSRSAVGPDTITALTVPGTPGNPTYSGTTQNSTNVSWTAGSGATSYGVARCQGAGCAMPGSSWDGVTSPYTDSSLNCNTTYRYWVIARNSCGSTVSLQGTSITTSACTAPSISFNPTSRSWSSSDASVLVTATDSSGISYVHYCWTTSASCDPGTASSNDSPFTCSGTSPCSATITKNTTGQWNLCARARNTAGNWSAAVCSGIYQVDKTNPTIGNGNLTVEGAGLGASATITTVGEKPTVIWSSYDGESGLNHVELWRTDYNSSTCNGTTMTGCSWSQIWTNANASNSSGLDDTTASDSGNYLYGLHALDNVDNCALENNQGCSGNSGNPIHIIMNIGGAPPPPCTGAPSQPTNLAHIDNTVNSITWSWTAPVSGDPPTEYRIYNGAGQLVGTTANTTYTQTTVTDGGAALSANTQYTVYVIAANSCGASGSSGSASAYTSANPPASCSGSAVSSSAINWSWVSGGAQNSFYASNSAGDSNWLAGTSWSQSGLACGTSYTTSVKARNQEGDETASVQCSAATSACAGGGGDITAGFQWCAASDDTIIFIDSSTGGVGGVTGWVWDFGDSQTCLSTCNTGSYNGSNQYPVHQYTLTPSGPVTKTFSENGSADYSGVTYDGYGSSRYFLVDTNYGDSSSFEVGTGSSGRVHRGWFKFDFTSALTAAGVTDSSQITGATLRIYSYDPDASGMTVDFHALLKNWVESEATWNSYRSGSAWSTAGAGAVVSGINGWVVGDYDGARDRAYNADFSYTNPVKADSWIVESGANLLNRIKFWFDNPTKNYGYLAKRSTEPADEHGFKLISSEHATLSWRPQLSITYSAPASTDKTVILTASDSVSNSDQEIKTVHLDPINYSCSALGCEAACYTPTACSTSQCDNNANGFRYQQTRGATCDDNCHCPAWSAYQTCQDSYNNCSDSAPYQQVECYAGTGCDTAVDACTCSAGYEPDGAGGCQLEEFTFYEIASLGSTQLSLRWQKQGATNSYFVTRGGLVQEVICDTDPCYYTDTGLSAGTTYTYYILARVGGSGIYNSTGAPNTVCVGSPTNTCPLSGTTDSVVGNFTIAPTCGQLSLSWNNLNVGGVTGYLYNVYKSTVGPNDQGSLLKQVTAVDCANGDATCTLVDKEVLPKTSYYYTIITEKDGEVSSAEAKANSKSYCYEAPGWEER